uniref:Uncharacterized protein n=1 Tax=Rhizophora mucronata TaxID=61149 RepID=A0A2P2KZ70_RHIMU
MKCSLSWKFPRIASLHSCHYQLVEDCYDFLKAECVKFITNS